MGFRTACQLFGKPIPFFFVFGLLLLIGLQISDDRTKSILEDVFFEHMAAKSVILLLSVVSFMAGVCLFFFGPIEADGLRKNWIYKYIIEPSIEVGITLCAVLFSLVFSLLVFAIAIRNPKVSEILLNIFCIAIIASMYWVVSVLLHKNNFIGDRRSERIVGVFLISIFPLVYFIIA